MDVVDMQEHFPNLGKSKKNSKRKINHSLIGKPKIVSLIKNNIHLNKDNFKLKEKISVLRNKLQRGRDSIG